MYSTAYCPEPNKIDARRVRMSHRSLFRAEAPLKHMFENPIIFALEAAKKEYIKGKK